LNILHLTPYYAPAYQFGGVTRAVEGMARSLVARKLAALGGRPVLRQGFRTDNGNEILDVRNLRITDPVALEEKIGLLAGVVEVGLFARRGADVLLVAGDGGVQKLTR